MSKRVLFVCMGNICRSPAGEAVMKRFAEEFRVPVDVDSAGTHGYHVGEPADSRMRAAAEARGYELTGVARQVTREDLSPDQFDVVLAMDSANHAILTEMAGGIAPHIRLFSDYLDEEWPKRSEESFVNTPYEALILASINIFGGFFVTYRMLSMYKKKVK